MKGFIGLPLLIILALAGFFVLSATMEDQKNQGQTREAR